LKVSGKNEQEITGWSSVLEVGAAAPQGAVKFHPGVVGKWADIKNFKFLNRISFTLIASRSKRFYSQQGRLGLKEFASRCSGAGLSRCKPRGVATYPRQIYIPRRGPHLNQYPRPTMTLKMLSRYSDGLIGRSSNPDRGKKFFSTTQRAGLPWGPYRMGTWGSLPWDKATAA
jgi:hypothetical protein